MQKKIFFSFIALLSLVSIAQTGPTFVKNSLANQGAFVNPTFEFTTEFDDEKDSNNPNSTVRGV